MNFRQLLLIATAWQVALPGQAGLVHRWSFDDPAELAVVPERVFLDSVGNAPAVVRSGTNAATTYQATLTGTGIALPGTTTGNAALAVLSAYVDLPNGMVSSKTNLTVEIWAAPASYQSFSRLLDFGRVAQAGDGLGASGEFTGAATTAPGVTQASDGLTLTLCRSGATLNQQRLAGKLNVVTVVNATGLYRIADTNLTTVAGTEYHYVMTFEDGVGAFGATGGRLSWYRNGGLAASVEVGFRLNQVEDVNNWLGRSLFTNDRQANATFNEVRVFDHAFTAAEVTASRAAGVNPAVPVGLPDAVTMNHGAKAAIAVRNNDTNAVSVEVVQAPFSGTAVPDGDGRIRYTHTAGLPATDSFTYRARNVNGTSAPVTVTVNFSQSLRIANSTLNIPATPPPTAWQLNDAVTGLSNPLCMATPPGETQRLFICQKGGLIRVVGNITVPSNAPPTFLNLPALLATRGEGVSTNSEQGLLGLAFHPQYATNRYFYVFYSVDKDTSNATSPIFERVSRFTTRADDPNLADPASELVLIEQEDQVGNHNGGDLHFGPDGYLYITTGDEGDQNDARNNSQRITKDFFCAILRIDVDKLPTNLEPNAHPNPTLSDPVTNAIPRDETPVGSGVFQARYRIPLDNPYVHTEQGGTWDGVFNGAAIPAGELPYVRSEFWATGFRNPWRISFDPPTGELWVGDVGGGAREEIDVVTKGKNYGWAYREGAVAGPKSAQAPANFATLYGSEPVYDYAHGTGTFQGNSVTGGIVYRGTRFSSLIGAYLFADYSSGNLWTLRRNGVNPPTVERLMGEGGLAAFARDPSNGDVLIANVNNSTIRRLVGGTPTGTYPLTLGATNLFADLADLSPNPSLLPYTVNLPFWSDFAQKRRWFTIPDGVSRMTWSRDGVWTFPAGQIWVKHFDLPLIRSDPPAPGDPLTPAKRLETRVLVKTAAGSYGVSYRWNDAGTDATLVPDEGADFDVAVTRNGAPYTQRWRIPSRAECLSCHTPQGGHALSADTRQLNRPEVINGFAGNQLSLLHNAGYFTNPPEPPNVLPRHLRPDETGYPVEARARSYLAVNCAYCHQAGGTAAPAAWEGRPELTLDATGLINGAASNNGGSTLNKLIVPGDLTHSIVLNRMALTNGFTRMPPLGSNELDPANITLITDWILNSLPTRQTYADWRTANFGASPDGEPTADPDGDGAVNTAEFLGLTNPLHGGSFLRTNFSLTGGNIFVQFNVPTNRSAVIETTFDFANWSLWDVPGNGGLPQIGGSVTLFGPVTGPQQFFRLRVSEN